MKQVKIAMLAVTTLVSFALFAQQKDSAHTQQAPVFYTIVYNDVPEDFRMPVVGLINKAEGNYSGVQLGLTNTNEHDFRGTQVAFANVVGGNCKGAQVGFANACKYHVDGIQAGYINSVGGRMKGVQGGFVNLVKDSLKGTQIGYVNLTGDHIRGGQVGFVNLCKDSLTGIQVGYVNLVRENTQGTQIGFVNASRDSVHGGQVGYVNVCGKQLEGVQVGFVNACIDSLDGTQVGYVNVSNKTTAGAQVGFVNVTHRTIRGTQVGFINVADSFSKGVPVGFLSVVHKGGYQSLAVEYTELYPVNLTFRIGTKRLYTLFTGGYDSRLHDPFSLGAGFGTFIPLSSRLDFNPEIQSQVSMQRHPQHFVSLVTPVHVSITRHIGFSAGPTVVWTSKENFRDDSNALHPVDFSLYKKDLNTDNRLHVGVKASLRVAF